VLAGFGGATLGCNDPRKAIEAIAREEPPALSRLAEKRPGGGAESRGGAAAPGSPSGEAPSASAIAAEPAGEGALDGGDEGAKASLKARGTSSRGQRRRSGSGVDAPGVGRGDSAEERAAPELKVLRLVVSRGVAGREPLGPATSFASAEVERVYAFVELANDSRVPSEIGVTFTPPGGGALQEIKLEVGSQKRWRTWAATRKARAPGVWSVAVSDVDGNELARTSFTMTK
jgi:hypothetical protein